MIQCARVTKTAIRGHYDVVTPFYRLFWGPHIHHGLWETGDEPPDLAQRRLIDRLAQSAGLRRGESVLDVGCGMGGSSIVLANDYGCRVTGVTLSGLQSAWAGWSARWHGVGRRARFLCRDAERMRFPPESFDVVWSVECTEHLFDKAGFFRRAAGWLRPGGRLAICAWLAGESPDAEEQVQAVGAGFLCPSFGTAADYQDWFSEAGLVNREFSDLTPRVLETWDICRRRVERSGVGVVAWVLSRRTRTFLDHFTALGNAYRSGAMQYGLFIAEKPQ